MAKIEKLKDLYINDLLPKEIYERDYKALVTLLEDVEKKEEEPKQKKIDLNTIKNLKKIYAELTPESRKAFWSRVLKNVIVTPEGDYIISLNQL